MRPARHKKEQGSTIFESVLVILVLCLIFFGMIQIYQWSVRKLFTGYAAFYGARALAQGYSYNIAQRGVRVAAIGISGARLSSKSGDSSYDGAKSYMQEGDRSGVEYEYWYPRSSDEPYLSFTARHDSDTVEAQVKIENADLIGPRIKTFFGVDKAPECASTVQCYNYGQLFLE